MTAHRASHRIAMLCRVLGVSPSGYYAWRQRPLSARARADVTLGAQIQAIHGRSRGTYGVPRVHAELAANGVHIGRKRVARLMRAAGVQGVSRRKRQGTTRRDPAAAPAPDLVSRAFAAAGPDRLWVADITYIPTWAGFLYLAVVLDVWSRRVIGWAMATHLRTELVLDALNMAVAQRRPTTVIHHSDQGCQYTSITFGLRCREARVRPSMGSVGDASTTPSVRAFSPPSSASCWTGAASRPRPKPGWPSSTSSRAGTTRIGGILAWTTCRRSAMNNGIPSSRRTKAVHHPRKRGNSSRPPNGANTIRYSALAGSMGPGPRVMCRNPRERAFHGAQS